MEEGFTKLNDFYRPAAEPALRPFTTAPAAVGERRLQLVLDFDYYSTFRLAMRDGKRRRTAKSGGAVLGLAQIFGVGVSFCADRPSDREAQKIRAGLACPDGMRVIVDD